MKFWRSKCCVILLFLVVLLCMGAMSADSVQKEISAEVLSYLQANVKPPVIELLATSEFNTSEELVDRLEKASEVLKAFVQKYGFAFDQSQMQPRGLEVAQVPEVSLPEAAPSIVAVPPVLPVPGATVEDADDSSQSGEEVKPEPPAAALSSISPASSSGVPDVIQPPAALAAPIVPAAPVIPGLPSIPAIPGPIGILPEQQVQEEELSDEATIPAPTVVGAPGIDMSMPELPALGDIVIPPATVPVLPAPVVMPVPNAVPSYPVPAAPMTITPLAPLPLAYQELESLDREMNSLIAVNLSTIALPHEPVNLPAQPLDIVAANQQNELSSELMSVNVQDVPEVATNVSLDSLSLQDLTLAELE